MWGYILGIIFGSFFMTSMFFVLSIYLFNGWKHNRMLKAIGLKAEIKINNEIKTWAKQTKNFFVASSLFKYENNKFFKVDSILITPQALFIIEIKSIKGSIKGDSHLSYWLKEIQNKQFKIANPIIQNEKHIEHIMKMIKMKIPTVSLIIFSDRSDLLEIKNIPNHVLVFKHNKLFEILDDIKKSLKISLTEYEMKTIYSIIKTFTTNKYKDKKDYKKIMFGER